MALAYFDSQGHFVPDTDEEIFKWCKSHKPFLNTSFYCGSMTCSINPKSEKLGSIVQNYCFGKFFDRNEWDKNYGDYVANYKVETYK